MRKIMSKRLFRVLVVLVLVLTISSSGMCVFATGRLKFTTPQNVQLDENLVASWDVSENDYLASHYCVLISFTNYFVSHVYYYDVNTDPNAVGTRYTVDLYEEIKDLYLRTGVAKNEKLQLRVRTGLSNEDYLESDDSPVIERPLNFQDDRLKFATPQNVQLDENFVASWDISENDHLASHYCVLISFTNHFVSYACYYDVNVDPKAVGTRYTVDLYEKIKDLFRGSGVSEKEKLRLRVRTGSSNEIYLESDDSPVIERELNFQDTQLKFTTPQNVQLDENLVASWDISENDYLASRYTVLISFSNYILRYSYYYDVNTDPNAVGTRYTVDLYDVIRDLYLHSGVPEDAKIELWVRTGVSDDFYTASDLSPKVEQVMNLRTEEGCVGGNHDMGDFVQIISPTCTTVGTERSDCLRCDYYETREIPISSHTYVSKVTIPATHLATGVKTYTCDCGDTYTETIDKIAEHNYESVVTAPTCEEKGYTTYTCKCGDTYVDNYVNALGHTSAGAVEENYVAPTCIENGSKDVVVYCSVCDEEISRETVTLNATGHADNDGDGYCDADNELLDPTVDCSCNCHQSGITKFFFNFVLFFQKLFGSNKECVCGITHY